MKKNPKAITPLNRKRVYAEGRKAFETGKHRDSNPYKESGQELAAIWTYGWDTAKKDNKPQNTPDDPERTIPRPR